MNIAPSRSMIARIFLPFAAGYLLSYLYRTMNAVLSPHLVADVHIDASDLGLLTSAYFLAFATFQIPLGILLDRFGPRRVEALLLLFAATGAVVFALSTHVHQLLWGRALIGLGVSACLMASFKAFALWFPVQKLPAMNGWIMAFGGLGALAATAPLEWALAITNWRGVFMGLATVSVGVAAMLWRMVPEHQAVQSAAAESPWHGLATIYRSAVFWRIAPSSIISQAAFMAIQGLWAGPWLRDVAGYDPHTTAHILFWAAVAMAVGFISIGQLTYALVKWGVTATMVTLIGMALFMLVQVLLLCDVGPQWFLWAAFGGMGTIGTVSYALLTQQFPAEWAGRVNTALNFLVFCAAFIAQWGVGAIVNQWPTAHGYAANGYRWALGILLVLQALTWTWLLVQRKDHR